MQEPKLIEQFKKYGQSKSGKIGFGQGSEQLYFRNKVTTCVTEQNFKKYLKDPNLGIEKKPIPKILLDTMPIVSDTKTNLLKGFKSDTELL